MLASSLSVYWRRAAIVVVVCLSVTSTGWAIDYWGGPPSPENGGWVRGEPGSTYQKFDMTTPIAGPNPANINENPFGCPTIEMYEGEWEWGIVEGPAGDGTTVDAWHSASEPGGGTLKITIPNDPQDNPIKKIYIQMTTTKSPTSITVTGTDAAGGSYTSGTFPTGRPSIQHPGGVAGSGPWYTYSYGLTIKPNPKSEDILINMPYCAWIDQIDIDTICTIPEPATMCLLGLGGLAILRRRRRA